MKKSFLIPVFILLVLMITGCSAKYTGSGLDDFRRSSELLEDTMTLLFSEVIDGDMELRAESSIEKNSISASDLEPVIMSYENLRVRKDLLDSLVVYSRLLKAFFKKDHTSDVREYGEELKENLIGINSSLPDTIPNGAAGIITSMISMAPESITFARKKKFSVKLMREMQNVIKNVTGKLRDEINSLQLLVPNLFTRLFREKVEKRWPDKKDKRVKIALTGVKIIKKREKLMELTNGLLKALEMLHSEHRELTLQLGGKGNNLTGFTDLLNFCINLKNNYDVFTGGK